MARLTNTLMKKRWLNHSAPVTFQSVEPVVRCAALGRVPATPDVPATAPLADTLPGDPPTPTEPDFAPVAMLSRMGPLAAPCALMRRGRQASASPASSRIASIGGGVTPVS